MIEEHSGKFLLTIIGHVAGHDVNEAMKQAINRLKKGGKPVNHDLQKAIRRSYFSSLQTIATDCHNELMGEPPWEFMVGVGGKSYPVTLTKKLFKNIAGIVTAKLGMKLSPRMTISPVYSEHRQELEWLDRERTRLAIALGKMGQEKFSDKISEFTDEAEAMLNPSDDEAVKEKILDFKEKLTEEVLKDNHAPECFKKKVHETFFDLMRDHFFWEIKHDPLVFNIFVASELAKISQKSHPPSQGKITLDIDTISTPHLIGILEELKERGNDITLKIRRIEQGTVTLVLEGSKEGLERLESLFKSGELTEILGVPVKDVRVSFPIMPTHTKRMNLSQWLLKKFDDAIEFGWQDSAEAIRLAPAFRHRQSETVKVVKQIPVSDKQAVILEAGLTSSENHEVSVCFRVYPVAGQKFLPENLMFALLSDSGEILKHAKVEGNKDIIMQELKGLPGEQFDIRIALGDISITEHFVI